MVPGTSPADYSFNWSDVATTDLGVLQDMDTTAAEAAFSVGEFKDDKYHGQGTYSFASGKKHVGEWKNGLPNGLGVQTYADGRVKKGIWKNGKFLYAKKP